jgi:hypothetical protein
VAADTVVVAGTEVAAGTAVAGVAQTPVSQPSGGLPQADRQPTETVGKSKQGNPSGGSATWRTEHGSVMDRTLALARFSRTGKTDLNLGAASLGKSCVLKSPRVNDQNRAGSMNT